MSARVVGVIPARLESKRFPDKVLYPFQGKPLLYYVWHEVSRSQHIDRVVIATDNKKVVAAADSFGADAVLTSKKHRTGSDRAAEAVKKVGGDIIVNIQADNFGIRAAVLDRVIEHMKADPKCKYATLARRISRDEDLFDPNIVKVIMTKARTALWFSRFPLPYVRDVDDGERWNQFPFWEHIGVYFYRRAALESYSGWKRMPMEKAESLEQLRILENGGEMLVFATKMGAVSVDTPDDLKKLVTIYK